MIIIVLAMLALVWFLWDPLLMHVFKEAVSLKLSFSAGESCAGETVGFREIVENRSRLPLPVAEIGFRTEKGIEFLDAENIAESDYLYKRDVFSLLGRERITRTYQISAEKRGHYTLSQTTIRMRLIPSGKWHLRNLTETDSLYVYARRVGVREILMSLETIIGLAESHRRIYEDPFAYASIRDYTVLDPMKTINWKASAKSGSLMVNTFTSVRSEQIAVYLDVEDSRIVKEQDKVEECISVAACLTESLFKYSLDTCLVTGVRDIKGGPHVIGPGRGPDLRKEIEQYLTRDFTKDEAVPVPELLAAEPPGERIPVIITKNASNDLVRQLSEILGREGFGLLVAVCGRGETCPASGTAQVRVLRREVTL